MNSIAVIGIKGLPKDFQGTSGVEAYVEHQIPGLLKAGRVNCYVRNWATAHDVTEHNGARIIHIPSVNTTFLDTFTHCLLSTIHATATGSTTIWYHGIGPAFFAFIPRIFNKRVVVTIHSQDWRRTKWNFLARTFLQLSEYLAITVSSEIYVVSNQLKLYYDTKYQIHTCLEKYPIVRSRGVRVKTIRQKYGLRKNGYILFVGRFVPEKRLEWLINASEAFPRYPIVLTGGSSHSDHYTALIHSLAAGKNIIFTGYIFGKEKEELLSNCRLFVLPSSLEGFPISVTEALSYGKLCLVGDYLKTEFDDKKHKIMYFRRENYENFLSNFIYAATRP